MKKFKYRFEEIAYHFGFDFLDIEEEKIKDEVEKNKVLILKKIYKDEYDGKRRVGVKYKTASRVSKKDKKISLNVVNLASPVAEAMVLKTALEILKEEGYKDLLVEINSYGDKESRKNFKKKLIEYYKNHKADLKGFEQKKISSDPFAIYYSSKEYLGEINKNAPTPIGSLSEESAEFFKRFLEYVESFGVEYNINPNLVAPKQIFTKTIFKIYGRRDKKKDLGELAIGGRYDEVAGEVLKKKKFLAVGIQLNFDHKLEKARGIKDDKVKINLLKIGSEAEIEFLKVLEIFKNLNYPVKFLVEETKISKQIEKLNMSDEDQVLILGVKEVKEGKIAVRDNKTMSQKKIFISDLQKYFSRLLK